MPQRLRRVGVKEDVPRDRAQRADLRHRLDDADLVMRRHHRDDEGAVGERRFERGERDQAVLGDRQVGDAEPFALQGRAAFEHAFVLGQQSDDVVFRRVGGGVLAREMRRALQGKVVGLGRAGGEHDLARIGVDEARNFGARPVDRRHRAVAVDMAFAVRVAVIDGEIRHHRLEHARVDRG